MSSWPMKIENYREESPDHMYTVATFDVFIPQLGITFHNVKLNKAKRGTHYPSYPSFMHSQDEETGKKNFKPYYAFTGEKQKEFNDAILDALVPLVPFEIVRDKR